MDNDDWTTAAAKNDALVADLLLRLKHSRQTDGLILFRWGRRKARSRPDVTRFAVVIKEFKERVTRSPTTPLSWSGGCGMTSVSGSGNLDGFEASSSMISGRFTGSRSKITASYELVNDKKEKRKKTYNELKKEECLLLDERLNLKRNLATLHDTLTHHRTTNQNLKRIKSMKVHSRRVTTQGPIFRARDMTNEIRQPSFSSDSFPEATFALPDLNMLPSFD